MPGYKDFSDVELLVLLRESDEGAYTEIYLRYFGLAFVQAYRKLRDEEQAKDIVQEVFLNFWVNRAGCLSIANLAGYFVRAVRNRIFNFFASQDVRSRYVRSLAGYEVDVYSGGSDYLVRERQFAEYVERAVQSLPGKMRVIFELSRKEHLSHREIAEKLETSEHNVSKQVSNALKILRTKLSVLLILLGL